LSRFTKTTLSFFPLVAGQLLCVYALMKRNESIAWREATTTFLFFAVAGSISLISQIYNIEGELSSFLFTWMLLCLPLIYVMRSNMASLLYIIGITYYASEVGYFHYPHHESYWYWLLLIGVLPHYYFMYKENVSRNFLSFHNWLLPLSILFALGTISDNEEDLLLLAYVNLLAVFYILGNTIFYKSQKLITNGFIIIGSVGTVCLLLVLSFSEFWDELDRDKNMLWHYYTPEWMAAAILFILAIAILISVRGKKLFFDFDLMEIVFIIFFLLFNIGMSNNLLPVIIINLLLFALGVSKILRGAKLNHLGILNYGLLIIAALITCRFFDIDLSYLARGILFVLVGGGFFAGNYWFIQKRKSKEIKPEA
ncbi:MAG: DUF2157 domain-containing protein, partial [Chitinophagales bacterium]|nr:DUF2157 domain-containing protein [Chitinophagales bacterium]